MLESKTSPAADTPSQPQKDESKDSKPVVETTPTKEDAILTETKPAQENAPKEIEPSVDEIAQKKETASIEKETEIVKAEAPTKVKVKPTHNYQFYTEC